MMTDQEILEKAHRDYPPGTKYICPYHLVDNHREVIGIVVKNKKFNGITNTKPMLSQGNGTAIYFDGFWAEIIPDEHKLDLELEQVRKIIYDES